MNIQSNLHGQYDPWKLVLIIYNYRTQNDKLKWMEPEPPGAALFAWSPSWHQFGRRRLRNLGLLEPLKKVAAPHSATLITTVAFGNSKSSLLFGEEVLRPQNVLYIKYPFKVSILLTWNWFWWYTIFNLMGTILIYPWENTSSFFRGGFNEIKFLFTLLTYFVWNKQEPRPLWHYHFNLVYLKYKKKTV